MRLTRRGKTVIGLAAALNFLFHPMLQSEAVAPIKDRPKEVALRVEWTPDMSKDHAESRLIDYGWSQSEFACLESMWTKESNWRKEARNKQSVTQIRDGKRVRLHAGGIPQILGLDPNLPAPQQIRRGFEYIDARYGTPCRAWEFWKRNGYY